MEQSFHRVAFVLAQVPLLVPCIRNLFQALESARRWDKGTVDTVATGPTAVEPLPGPTRCARDTVDRL